MCDPPLIAFLWFLIKTQNAITMLKLLKGANPHLQKMIPTIRMIVCDPCADQESMNIMSLTSKTRLVGVGNPLRKPLPKSQQKRFQLWCCVVCPETGSPDYIPCYNRKSSDNPWWYNKVSKEPYQMNSQKEAIDQGPFSSIDLLTHSDLPQSWKWKEQ
jgi:hypothetical protein